MVKRLRVLSELCYLLFCNEFPDCHVYLFCVWQACLPDPWPTCWSRFRSCFEGPPAAALWTPEQAAIHCEDRLTLMTAAFGAAAAASSDLKLVIKRARLPMKKYDSD